MSTQMTPPPRPSAVNSTPPNGNALGLRSEEPARQSPAKASEPNGGAVQAQAANAKRASADVEDETFKSEEDQVAASSDKTASGSRRKVDSPEGAKSSKRRKVDSPKKTIAQTRKATESQSSKLSIHVPASGPALEAAHELQTRYWIAQGSPLFPIDYSKASQWDRDMLAKTAVLKREQEILIAKRVAEYNLATSTSTTRDLRDRGTRGAASGKKSGEKLSILTPAYNRESETSQAGKPATAPHHHPSVREQQRMPATSYPANPRSGHYGSSMQQQQQQRPPSQLPSPHYPPQEPRREMERDRDSDMERHRAWQRAQDNREREREEWAASARGREMDRERERVREREEWERDYRHGPSSSRPASIGQSGSRFGIAPITVPPLHGNGGPHDTRTIHSPYPLPEPNVPNLAASRQAFIQPFAQLFDQMHEARHVQAGLLDLFRRGDEFIKTQEKLADEMTDHYRGSLDMLKTLQESVDSVQTMVKHEVSVAREEFDAEVAVWQRRYEELSKRVMDKL